MCATMPSPKKVSTRCRVRSKNWFGITKSLQRPHGRNRNNALNSQLLKAVNVGPEIQFARQKFVPAGMAREKRHLATLKSPQNVSVRRISKWRLLLHLVRVAETRHVVQTAAADNANLCLLQVRS